MLILPHLCFASDSEHLEEKMLSIQGASPDTLEYIPGVRTTGIFHARLLLHVTAVGAGGPGRTPRGGAGHSPAGISHSPPYPFLYFAESKEEGAPLKLKCELCGRVDFAYKFKRSKRFCSMACAKR